MNFRCHNMSDLWCVIPSTLREGGIVQFCHPWNSAMGLGTSVHESATTRIVKHLQFGVHEAQLSCFYLKGASGDLCYQPKPTLEFIFTSHILSIDQCFANKKYGKVIPSWLQQVCHDSRWSMLYGRPQQDITIFDGP